MKKRLPAIILAVAGIGLLVISSIQAQQPATNTSQVDQANAKPCVVVLGAVRSPTRFELRRPVRLAEVLAMVGGLTERAGQRIRVIHYGPAVKCYPGSADQLASGITSKPNFDDYSVVDVTRDREKDPYLRAGDLVIVDPAPEVYVAGDVIQPRALLLTERLTLTKAIARAGGVLRSARTQTVTIIRASSGEAGTKITADFDAISKGQAEDPLLQPYDIVIVGPLGGHPLRRLFSAPVFDSRPLIPRDYRVIF